MYIFISSTYILTIYTVQTLILSMRQKHGYKTTVSVESLEIHHHVNQPAEVCVSRVREFVTSREGVCDVT